MCLQWMVPLVGSGCLARSHLPLCEGSGIWLTQSLALSCRGENQGLSQLRMGLQAVSPEGRKGQGDVPTGGEPLCESPGHQLNRHKDPIIIKSKHWWQVGRFTTLLGKCEASLSWLPIGKSYAYD